MKPNARPPPLLASTCVSFCKQLFIVKVVLTTDTVLFCTGFRKSTSNPPPGYVAVLFSNVQL